ncbi:MAG TPA: DUF4386 domain-containing protein [Streptosporangiaceae bacterium]|nr:DUF4386 domain-containing protein [Streptosporangiaceae bacterium]
MSEMPTGHHHDSGRYEIRIEGHLDARWAAWFDGLTLTHDRDSTTLIHGLVGDQAALHGLLQKVRDVGLPLVSVTQMDPISQRASHRTSLGAHPTKEIDMATTVRIPATSRVPMGSLRKTAFVAGVLYLITILASIPAQFVLYDSVLKNPEFIIGSGTDTGVAWGGLLELITALACIGTAVVLFPVVKRQNEGVALGFVTARVFEAGAILIGIVSLLSVVTLRQDLAGTAGADTASLLTTGNALVAIHDSAFLLGPGVIPGVNALLLGYLLYRSGLVPRVIPLMGLIGAPLILAAGTATLLGVTEQVSVWTGIATAPIFAWELSLGVWLVVKGFKPSPITAGMVTPATQPAYQDVDA